uniref:Uncharacterized protein n=1 Tax=Heterorhabditis bacteriophora TaxID=37862 RepID=A0A1I7WPR9_HETBA
MFMVKQKLLPSLHQSLYFFFVLINFKFQKTAKNLNLRCSKILRL